jgi:hypothetical protein
VRKLEPWLSRFWWLAVLVPVLSIAFLSTFNAKWPLIVLCLATLASIAMAHWLRDWIKDTLADVLFRSDSAAPGDTTFFPHNG